MASTQPNVSLGRALEDWRTRTGTSQEELARTLGVSQQTVSRWEAGVSRPRGKHRATVEELISGTPLDRARDWPIGSDRPLAGVLPLSALSADAFEEFCKELIARLHPAATARRRGVSGDQQGGIDIEVLDPDGDWFATCKQVRQFGPAEAQKLLAEVGPTEDRIVLCLSRDASRGTRSVLEGHANWEIWDLREISSRIRRLSLADQTLLVRTFFPSQLQAFVGITDSRWLLVDEFFRSRLQQGGLTSLGYEMLGADALRERVMDWSARAPGRILLVTGRPGSGRSRSILEAARTLRDEGWTVRYIDGSHPVTLSDLAALPPAGAILVKDDLDSTANVAEFLRHAAADQRFRLVASCNSATLPSVRAALLSVGVDNVTTVEVPQLDDTAMQQLIRQRTQFALNHAPAHRLALMANGSPLMGCVLASLVAESGVPHLRGDAETHQAAVRHYLDSVLQGVPAPRSDAERALIGLTLAGGIPSVDAGGWAFAASGLGKPEAKAALDALVVGGVVNRTREGFHISSSTVQDFALQMSSRMTDWEALFDELEPARLGQALTSLARATWLTEGSWSRVRKGLGIGLSRTLHDVAAATPFVLALEQASWVAPGPVMELLEALLSDARLAADPVFATAAAKAATGALRDPETAAQAADLLWTLGRDRPGQLHQQPDHPLRILGDALEPAPSTDLRAIDAILTRIGRWKDSDEPGQRSPFEALESVFGTEGHEMVASDLKINFFPFAVEPARVSEVRAKAIAIILSGLSAPSPGSSRPAAECLTRAFGPPHGLFGATPEPGLVDRWRQQFRDELSAVATELATMQLDPSAADVIRDAFAARLRRGSALSHEIRKVLAALPNNLETRLTTALCHDWNHGSLTPDLVGADFETLDAAWRLIRLATIQEWSTTVTPEEAANWLFNQIGALNVTSGFARLACVQWPALAEAILSAAETGDLVAGRVAPDALAASAEASNNITHAARKLLQRQPQVAGAVCRAVASAGWHRRPHPDELALLLAERDRLPDRDLAELVRALAHAPYLDRQERLRWVLDTPIRSTVVAEAVAYEMNTDPNSELGIPAEAAAARLGELVALNDIDEWAIGRLIERLARSNPEIIAEFLLARMRRFIANSTEYHAIPFSWRDQHRLGITDPDSLSLFLRGLDAMPRETWQFQWAAPQAFALLVSDPSPAVQRALDRWASQSPLTRLPLAAILLRDMARPLIWEQLNWLAAFLNHSDRAGVYTEVAATLLSGFASGIKSGTPGQPFPQDLDDLDRANRVLEGLPYGSVERRFYSSVKTTAEASIDWSRTRGL